MIDFINNDLPYELKRFFILHASIHSYPIFSSILYSKDNIIKI